jgi:hypothetical protein
LIGTVIGYMVGVISSWNEGGFFFEGRDVFKYLN